MKRYRGLLIRGSLLLMESLWAYALVAFLVAVIAQDTGPTFIGTAAVVCVSFGISRALQNSNLSLGVLRFYGAFLSFLIFYAIVRVDFYGDFRIWDFSWVDSLFNSTRATLEDDAEAVIGVPLLWAFWIRGVMRGQQSTTFEDVTRSFAAGVIVVATAVLFSGIVDDLPREVDFVPVPYIAVGLLAMGLAHAGRAADEFDRDFGNVWLGVAGGAVLVMGLLALLFIVVDFEMAKDGLSAAVRGIGWLAAGIFYVVLYPIFLVLEFVFGILGDLIEKFWGGEQNPPAQEPPEQLQPEPDETGESPIPNWFQLLIRVLVAGSLVSAIVIGTVMVFARFRKREVGGEVRESTYQEGRLAADLSNLWGNVFGRFRRHDTPSLAVAESRRLYFEMLEAAAARGVERRTTETPLELSPRLARTFGPTTPAAITDMFDNTRYGGVEPTSDELRRLREDWERIPKL